MQVRLKKGLMVIGRYRTKSAVSMRLKIMKYQSHQIEKMLAHVCFIGEGVYDVEI